MATRGVLKKVTLPSARSLTLGTYQNFAECRILALGNVLIFAECRPLGTRQMRRHPLPPRAKFAECCWLSATPLPSAREVALGKDPFAVRGFAECSCRVYGKAFAECKQAFAKCNWHSAKKRSPVVHMLPCLLFWIQASVLGWLP